MSIAADLAADIPATISARPCVVGTYIDNLDPADRDAVNDYLAAGKPRINLYRYLRERHAFQASQSALNIHARRDCHCPAVSELVDA
ncbi:hypothetical protein [Rhodococcoides fascians]|uniref:hypothetical protein n=1 Tax=Rhodococcoides fascians TaxID=1828 RepID=UPI00050CB792|nr:hypothetical protein [Rhodococcus fascians]